MAPLKIYRLAYYFENDIDIMAIRFSDWVIADEIESLEDKINSLRAKVFCENPEIENPEGLAPIILAWEEKVLDTEPV